MPIVWRKIRQEVGLSPCGKARLSRHRRPLISGWSGIGWCIIPVPVLPFTEKSEGGTNPSSDFWVSVQTTGLMLQLWRCLGSSGMRIDTRSKQHHSQTCSRPQQVLNQIDTRSKQHHSQTSNSGRLNIIDFFGYNKFFLIV